MPIARSAASIVVLSLFFGCSNATTNYKPEQPNSPFPESQDATRPSPKNCIRGPGDDITDKLQGSCAMVKHPPNSVSWAAPGLFFLAAVAVSVRRRHAVARRSL